MLSLVQARSLFFLFINSICIVFFLISFLGGRFKIISSIVICLYAFILGSELASIVLSGRWIDVLTWANITEYQAVDRTVIYSSAGIIGSFLLVAVFFPRCATIKVSKWFGILFLPLILLYVVNGCEGPSSSFVSTFRQYLRQVYFSPSKAMRIKQKKLYGKDWVYQTQREDIPNLRGKNIVVAFTEGFSLDVIDKFNKYPHFTPNLSAFLDESLWFDNYFNHTAATYRGLRGQLSSSFQYSGGYRTNNIKKGFSWISKKELKVSMRDTLVTLPMVLRQYGYNSYFISGRSHTDKLNSYLEHLGFDKVFIADDFRNNGEDLSDQEIYKYLGELMKSGTLKEPYFIGFYNVGTHWGVETKENVYNDNGKTNNDTLNVFHNLDDAFGKFWHMLKSDEELLQKTALVFTADHASWPSRQYVETFHDDRDYYMSRIPFALYYKGVQPVKLDAKGKNSLDFAPTLLHWMRINEGHNYFLGCSLYDETCAYTFDYVYVREPDFYQTMPVRALDAKNSRDADIMQKIRDYYNLSENRIFKWNDK